MIPAAEHESNHDGQQIPEEPPSRRKAIRRIVAVPESFFIAGGRDLFSQGWGDYGSILQHGMTAHLKRTNSRLSLERTGPYIPPVTFPGIGDVLVTSQAKEALESSGLIGFSFAPVEKVRIVELHWEQWDWSGKEPPIFPNSGEPEDYILERRHNPEVAAQLGDIWELVVPNTATLLRVNEDTGSFGGFAFDLASWNGSDLVRSSSYSTILFSSHAREVFLGNWPEFVEFYEFPVVHPTVD
jgi:hypothetical protein